ncbi:MAG: DNA polymerase IV [Streptococcaceae bacterium]|jgi:DNA polymerase-4|nr:DNA polymerase IV [Streptococcaceae bacterium]
MLIFPLVNDTTRKIIHIDMDAFFASVEQLDDPNLRGKPVVIGRNPLETGGRGVVSTCSYEARTFGVHSGMSAKEAYDLCPQAIFISGHFQRYHEISMHIRGIFERYTDKVQMASVDEAYLDVTENKLETHSAIKIAKLIQYDILHETGLTCSAGISYNKFLAKIGSDFQKPHGLTVIKPEDAKKFLAKLPIEKFHGVGKATVPKLNEMGIFTGGDLQKLDPVDLAQRFGVYGWSLYLKANGIHQSEVHENHERKSLGKERTFNPFLHSESEIKRELLKLAERVSSSMQRRQIFGEIVVLKLRYGDFTTFTKRKSVGHLFNDKEALYKAAEEILEDTTLEEKEIRLLGLTVTGFDEQPIELDLRLSDAG